LRCQDTQASRVSKDEIRADIEALPLRSGAVVFIHTSMSQLGYVEGGAATMRCTMSLLRSETARWPHRRLQ
jgi:aminoglycoside N3'-acetyltransferase